MKPAKSRLQIAEGRWQIENSELYPVRNNAPLLPPGQRPSGLAAAAGLHFRLIPAGFNAPLEFLTGFTYETTLLLSREKIPGKYKLQG